MAIGIIRYSATNSFGGRVQERFDCNKLTIIKVVTVVNSSKIKVFYKPFTGLRKGLRNFFISKKVSYFVPFRPTMSHY